MFKNNNSNSKKTQGDQTNTSGVGSVNSVGQGTVIEGSINAEGDLRIDGKIIGNLECQGKLILGRNGYIKGDVVCQNALVEGEIVGTLRVNETLQVKESAKIDGDINTDKLIVESGAQFNVNCMMGVSSTYSSSNNGTPKMAENEVSI